MLSLLFTICMIWIFGKLFIFGVKAAWGISKLLLTVVFLPLILVGMVIGGSDVNCISDIDCCWNCSIGSTGKVTKGTNVQG